jgi:hypothetical protein
MTDTNLGWRTGGADVHRGGAAVHRLLAAVPLLLRGRLHRRPSDNLQVRAARLHGLLLAGHVQRHDQSARLLLDERQVRHSIFLQFFNIFLMLTELNTSRLRNYVKRNGLMKNQARKMNTTF